MQSLPIAMLLASLPVLAMAQDTASLRVVNNTPAVVNEVYASAVGDADWGHDRLGSEVIAPGGSQVVRLTSQGGCRYDIRIVFQGGAAAEERRDVDVCVAGPLRLGVAAPARPPNGSFHLANRTRATIEQLFVVPSGMGKHGDRWGGERLGPATLRPGQRHAVRLPPGQCRYDIRVVLSGGDQREERGVDTCAIAEYAVR